MGGLYIHIPFCGQLCTYCDFHFSVSLKRVGEMVDVMCEEMRMRKEYLGGEAINTLYLGGGTPSILSIEQLRLLIRAAQVEFGFDVSQIAEFTVECNPEDLTRDYLVGLKSLGVTRLSIGIQSFNDDVLQTMNRRHNAIRAVQAVEDAKDLGFANISVDIIFGVPGCSDDMLIYDIEQVVKLDTQHVSVYHLTIEDKTVLGWQKRKGKFAAVDELISDRQYKIVERELIKAGFNHYEISNYALPNCEAVHNGSYWNGTKYIGIGPSAHSFDGVSRQWNIAGNNRYIEGVTSGGNYFEREELSDDDVYNEYIMTSLRRSIGFSLRDIAARWGDERVCYIIKEGERYFADRLLVQNGDRVMIESKHFLLSDRIIASLMI